MTNTILYTMKSIASILSLCFLVIFPTLAHDGQKGYCQNSETTADLVECIGNHHVAEQNRMKILYTAILNQDNKIDDMVSNQEKWLDFRDETCAIEGRLYQGGSLQRVQELDCYARMTANRVKHLQIIGNAMDEANIPEFANPPRWVNVLVRDYPDMFWGFGRAMTMDTDCDGIDENVVRGVDASHRMTLAIADSEQTGRPKISVLNFDDQKQCEISQNIMIEKLPEPKPEADQKLRCVQRLKIKTKSCGDFWIQYNNMNKIYQIIKQEK